MSLLLCAMYSLRYKMPEEGGGGGRRRSDKWKCCFCCHVRTGTIFFGIWHLLLHVLALSLLGVVLRHPELMVSFTEPNPKFMTASTKPLPEIELHHNGADIQLTLGEDPQEHYSSFTARANYYQDLNTCVIFTFCTFTMTLLMVYGAVKGKAVYLLPFFCLQVFDLCISSLSAAGFFLYLPNLRQLLFHSPRIPYHREIMDINHKNLAVFLLLVITIALVVKAYFIGVVWSCYKYLMLRVVPAQRTIHYIDTENLLPSYEAAVKKYPVPPPSYATAIRNQPAPPAVPTITLENGVAPPPAAPPAAAAAQTM